MKAWSEVSVYFCRKYQKLFNTVYFSNSMVHHLLPELTDIFSDDTLVVLETAKFITQLTNDQYKQFVEKISVLAKNASCEALIDCDAEKDCFSFHRYKRL